MSDSYFLKNMLVNWRNDCSDRRFPNLKKVCKLSSEPQARAVVERSLS
jgi:hypothetical protein